LKQELTTNIQAFAYVVQLHSSCDTQNKQRLFPYTSFIELSIQGMKLNSLWGDN